MNDNMEELSLIAAEQHREFMTAAAIESDLEVAYRLQLEEAMTASINIQTLEIEKLETEIKHRLVIETETETETKRPYGEGSSSSSNSEDNNNNNNNNNAEVFRVYFKGLWSEERVYGSGSSYKTVTVAGIGVAICDSEDEIVYELKKSLKLIEDERISRQSMEGLALVVALRGLVALVKRIVVFCDYYPLYQFVIGEWLPDQQNTIDVLDQVDLLRKSFTYCEFRLIARQDVKYVFGLAREAINSHIETKTQRSCGEGSSSSSKSEDEDSEVYGVYFKGLWSEEIVHGPGSCKKAMTVVGIGAAICDSTDEIIHELKKPLDLIEGERISRQCVEGRALIEALKAAASYKFKRLVVNCDYYPLYQFVIGEWLPDQQKTIDIVDEVDLLRKSFTYCEFRLIDRQDVKYVFRLAREAISSHIETGTHCSHGEGSSSSSKSKKDDSEVYGVYFKGLWKEERVYDSSSVNKRVTVAGIGAAICDSEDEIIYELKTPLDLIEGERISRECVEGQALIAALEGAASYKLKRIVVFCDFYLLHQFVIGELLPNQQKTIDILDQVDLLRKSFTYCEFCLIARQDVKYVFRLAREAMNSQIRKVVSTLEKLETCVICLDDISVDQFLSIEGCTHRYCYSCVKQHVEVKLLNGVLPKCPHEGCGIELRIESCEKFLNPKVTEMMRQRLKEDSIPVTEKVYCPNPRCSTLMSTKEALRHPVLVYGFGARACYNCHGNFCVYCRVPWHENMTCAEYKRRNPTPLVEESKLKNLAARNMWRQCIKCKHMIELAAGCYHMTCRCGYEFCYTCGAEWKNKKASCNCPLWHEENIIYN